MWPKILFPEFSEFWKKNELTNMVDRPDCSNVETKIETKKCIGYSYVQCFSDQLKKLTINVDPNVGIRFKPRKTKRNICIRLERINLTNCKELVWCIRSSVTDVKNPTLAKPDETLMIECHNIKMTIRTIINISSIEIRRFSILGTKDFR